MAQLLKTSSSQTFKETLGKLGPFAIKQVHIISTKVVKADDLCSSQLLGHSP